MKFLKILLVSFILGIANSSYGQWAEIDTFSTHAALCTYGNPMRIIEFNFLTPSCSFYWLFYGNGCGFSPSNAIGQYASIDSCASWNGHFYPGSYHAMATDYMPAYDYFEDTVFTTENSTYAEVYKRSTDCGTTWKGSSNYLHPVAIPSKISVYNGRYGYGCNFVDGYFYRLDHDTCYLINNYNHPTHFNLFKFFSDSIGLAATDDTIFKTFNGGNSWQVVAIDTSDYFYHWNFLDDSIGFIFKTNNIIYKTTDGGTTWHNFITTPNVMLESITNIGKDTLYGLYNPTYYQYNDTNFICYLMKSFNGGANWDSIPFYPGYYLQTIKMFTNNFGYILAYNRKNPNYYVFKMNSGLIGIDETAPIIKNVFPNPFTDHFTVKGISNSLMQVFDCTGRIVLSGEIKNNEEQSFTLNLSAGVYFVRITNSKNSQTIKLIKT